MPIQVTVSLSRMRMKSWGALLLPLVVLGVMLAFAPSAFAATFVVNNTADTADPAINGSCDTDGGTDDTPCTLRAAIQESNANGGAVVDAIDFNTGAMGVDPTITVAVGTTGSYPAITSEVDINGCSANPNSATPCVGLRSDSAATGIGLNFTVGGVSGAFQASVDGLAMTNWGTAVSYSDFGHGNTTFNMQNNFLGTKLDGSTAEANLGSSIFGSNATIGGSENAAGPTERNVFSNNGSFALQVASGDNTVIQGNLFGTNTAGTGAASPGNAENIEIAGATTIPSFNNPDNTKIGGTVTAGEAATTACDGVCNVIAAATSATQGFGIDLQGESSLSEVPAGSTTIAGNFVGLTADGTAALGNTNTGIRVGNASSITIGGAGMGDPARDRNYITGGTFGISQSMLSDDLTVQNNYVGLESDGTGAVSPPTFIGVAIGDTTSANPAQILDNRLAGPAFGIVIQLDGQGAIVNRNVIGIDAGGNDVTAGDGPLSIAGSSNMIGVGAGNGNTIGNSSGYGIIVEGNGNTVQGNHVGTDAGGVDRGNAVAGILVSDSGGGNSGDNNVIGGDTAVSENVISHNGADAIEIGHLDGSTETADGNLIARNRGTENGDLFVDLRTFGVGGTGAGFGNPADGPNGGIQAPTIDSGATSESVSGTAEPNATVRVYRTDTADGGDPNDIVAFVGSDVADGSGDWALSCPGTGCAAEPPGPGQFTANQTDATDNSSEFSKAESYTADAPNTTIDSGPANGSTTDDSAPTFGFTSNEAGSTFQCKVDGGGFSDCDSNSQHTTDELADGQHTFEVRAVDPANHTDPTPDSRTFTVDTTPPNTTINSGPPNGSTTGDSTPTFGFSGGSTFQCQVDGGSFAGCTSPRTVGPLGDGQHTFRVKGSDAVGNTDLTPASRTFTVDTSAPPPPPPPPPPPSNEFTLGELEGKILQVVVPGPGTVEVTDAAALSARSTVTAAKKKLKPSSATATGAGTVEVKLRLKKKAKKKLKKKGKVKVNAAVTFTPTGGTANTETAKLKVKKKKK